MFNTFHNKISVMIDKHIPVKQLSEKKTLDYYRAEKIYIFISRTISINQNLFTAMPNLCYIEISKNTYLNYPRVNIAIIILLKTVMIVKNMERI